MRLILFSAFAFAAVISSSRGAPNPDVAEARKRLQIDDNWHFQIEPRITIPSGSNTICVTDWVIKESPDGESDAQEMTRLTIDTNDWSPARTGENITRTHGGKFVWYRANLNTLLAAHPLKGPFSVFFAGAGTHAVVYLNGHKVTEHSATVHSLNASEFLQTGVVAQGASLVGETDGVPDCFQACLEPWWNERGTNVLAVMIRATTGGNNGVTDKTILCSGFPDESQPGFDDASWRTVNLPHDYVVEGKFDEKYNNQRAALPVPRAWYRKKINIAASDKGKSIWIDFDGIYRDSEIWLNGHFLGNHPSGYTSFRYDITQVANFGGENTLAVFVDPRVPEGWWYEGGGIYRHVWLNTSDNLHVAPWGTYITTEVKEVASDHPSAQVIIKTRVTNHSPADQICQFSTTVSDPRGNVVAIIEKSAAIKAGEEVELTQNAFLASVQLWSCESPKLYLARTKILRSNVTVDTYSTPFGIRAIRFDVNQGFLLNEKRVKIYGTCNHLDFAGVGIAMPDNLQAWRIAKLQKMGSNAWRTSHNPPSAEFLDACDRMGMLVMDENRHLADTYDRKTGNNGYVANDLGDLRDMLLRDRNHPSVILWSLCNEEEHTAANTRLYELLKARAEQYDTTRPFTAAILYSVGDSMERACDVIGLNYALGKRFDSIRNQFPGKPILGSETGSARADRGIYFNDPQSNDVKKNPPVYLGNYSTWNAKKEAPEANENITYWAPTAEREWVAGTFCWTGFDYKGEPSPSKWPAVASHFGIMDLCGFPKDAYYYYKAWWGGRQPIVHIMPHWNWAGREGQKMRVVVFSNCKQVELVFNGKKLGMQEMLPNQSLEWQVPYTPGKLEARGVTNGKRVAVDSVETTGSPVALKLRSDTPHLLSNNQDIAVAEISVVDAKGRAVPTANDEVTFSLAGLGAIAGVGNGDPASHESDAGIQCRAFNGHCACLIRAGTKAGVLVLKASSPGLKPALLKIWVK